MGDQGNPTLAHPWLFQVILKNKIQKDLDMFYQVYVFRTDWNTKMTALVRDWLKRFRLLSSTPEQNPTTIDKK